MVSRAPAGNKIMFGYKKSYNNQYVMMSTAFPGRPRSCYVFVNDAEMETGKMCENHPMKDSVYGPALPEFANVPAAPVPSQDAKGGKECLGRVEIAWFAEMVPGANFGLALAAAGKP